MSSYASCEKCGVTIYLNRTGRDLCLKCKVESNKLFERAKDLLADCFNEAGDFDTGEAARKVLSLAIGECAKIAEDYTRDDQGRAIAQRIRDLELEDWSGKTIRTVAKRGW